MKKVAHIQEEDTVGMSPTSDFLSNGSDDDDSNYSNCRRKAYSLKRKKRIRKNCQFQQGHWTYEEHELYLDFLKLNYERCMSEKQNKIFKQMSTCVVTRSAAQCRSHHQKFNPLSLECQLRNHRDKKPQQNGIIIEQMVDKPQEGPIQFQEQPTIPCLQDSSIFINGDVKLTMYSDDEDIVYQPSFEYY